MINFLYMSKAEIFYILSYSLVFRIYVINEYNYMYSYSHSSISNKEHIISMPQQKMGNMITKIKWAIKTKN